MWFNRLVLISAITMISQLDGYHTDKDMPLGRHRRKGRSSTTAYESWSRTMSLGQFQRASHLNRPKGLGIYFL